MQEKQSKTQTKTNKNNKTKTKTKTQIKQLNKKQLKKTILNNSRKMKK